jgi:hypothetical protein
VTSDEVRDEVPLTKPRPTAVRRAGRVGGISSPTSTPYATGSSRSCATVPRYAPPWIWTVSTWAECSKREVSSASRNDRRTPLWFADQRAVEYQPAVVRRS